MFDIKDIYYSLPHGMPLEYPSHDLEDDLVEFQLRSGIFAIGCLHLGGLHLSAALVKINGLEHIQKAGIQAPFLPSRRES